MEAKLIETLLTILVFFAISLLIGKSIDKTMEKRLIQRPRGKIAKKGMNTILLFTCGVFILFIWGVKQSDLLFFLGSFLTILGVALFVESSFLSNITAGIIIFFYHSVKLDDTIKILDKDTEVSGRVSDIGLFFVILKTETGEIITMPSNIFMRKIITHRIHV